METTTGIRPPAAPTAGTAMRFRPDIEGLRAVAVVLIVAHQAGVPGLAGGYLGVDVFLVVSGFLLTSLMLREIDATGRLPLAGFWCRRARRLLPTAALVLVSTVLAGYHQLGPGRGDEIGGDVTWTTLFAANFRPQTASSPVQHFGALAVAEQFSLVWPLALGLLLWLGFRWALRYWLVAAVLVSFAWSAWQGGAGWASSSPTTRAWELGAGCLLALTGGRLGRIPHRLATAMAGVGLAVIVVAALTFDASTPFPGHAAVPVLATVLVLAGRGDALLGRRPMIWLGRLAYPLSLWHWPIVVIAQQTYGGPPPAHVRALLVAAAVGLAAATHFGLEEPVRRSRQLRRSPLLTLVLAALLVLAPIAVGRWMAVSAPMLNGALGGALHSARAPSVLR